MRSHIKKHQVKKIGTFYRALSFFIAICSLLSIATIAGIVIFEETEEVTIGIIIISLMPVITLYICTPIAFTGYPPKFLFWSMDKASTPDTAKRNPR